MGISPQEMMRLYASQPGPYDLAKDQTELENKQLTQMQKVRSLSEPSEADRAQQRAQEEQFRFTINKFTDLIKDEKLSPTAREVYKGMMKNYVSAWPKEFQASAGPALAYSPIDPVEDGMDRFERLYPRPMAPQTTEQTGPNAWKGGEAPRDETNEVAWARYDIGAAEWKMRYDMMRDKLSGINPPDKTYEMPKLFQGSTPDSYWYKDKMTGQIGNINMKYIPQGELETAINKYGWSLPDFMRTGMYPIAPQQTETIGNGKYSVRLMRSVTDGQVLVDKIPLGPKESSGSVPNMPDDLSHALSIANMGGSKDLAKNPTQSYLLELFKETQDTFGSPEGKKNFDKLNAEVNSRYGYMIAAYDPHVSKTWRSYIPVIGNLMKNYTMDDGTFMGVGPVRNTPVPFVNAQGKGALLYYSDAIKMAVDARGMPVPETRGVVVPKDITGPVMVPNLQIEPPKPQTPTKIQEEKSEVETMLRGGWVPSPAAIIGWLITEKNLTPEEADKIEKQIQKNRGNAEKIKAVLGKFFGDWNEENK